MAQAMEGTARDASLQGLKVRAGSAAAGVVCLHLGQGVLGTAAQPQQLCTEHAGQQATSEAARELQAHVLSCGLRDCFQLACSEDRFTLRLWGQTCAAALLCLPVWEGRAAQLLPAGPGRASHRRDTRNSSPIEECSCRCAWGREAELRGLSSAL